MQERHYEFRKFLDSVHQSGRRDYAVCARPDEVSVTDEWVIRLPSGASSFMEGTARDLQEYFWVSMDLSVRIVCGDVDLKHSISLEVNPELQTRRSFTLTCGAEKIRICGADERGTAMGSYYLQDVMNLREAPLLPECSNLYKEPVFSPRMVHSAYGMDIFTDSYLRRIAHAGFDSILLFLKDQNHGYHGACDFNEIIDQAEAAGLDVYLYSTIVNRYHPSDPEAPAFYEQAYGGLFRRYPKARGIVLVGESCRFPSHDPMTTGSASVKNECCFRSGKPNPGWWPCEDFPEFVDMVKNSIHKFSPEADVIFWTYNWGNAPEKYRTRLIDHLPGDISVEVNFAMHDSLRRWNTMERALDYTVASADPSRVFLGEAAAVTRRPDLRLYAMSNSAGRTWDIGAAPYLPVLQQWETLMTNLLKAHEQFGLQGLMETHHYGFYPSIVAEMAKWLFWTNGPSPEEILKQLAVRDFSEEVSGRVLAVWEKWSRAQADYVTPIEDQYGPCRVGPSFPFIFEGISLRSTYGLTMKFPWTDFNMYEIAYPEYKVVNDPDGLDLGARRTKAEIRHLPEIIGLWNQGADELEMLLEEIPERKRQNARRMIGIGRFIANTLTTTLNVKKWWLENHRLVVEDDPRKATEILDRIQAIAHEELENVRRTIPLVQEDSSLGYEPSMDYTADEEHLQWKIRQLNSVLNTDIPAYRKGIALAEQLEQEDAEGVGSR